MDYRHAQGRECFSFVLNKVFIATRKHNTKRNNYFVSLRLISPKQLRKKKKFWISFLCYILLRQSKTLSKIKGWDFRCYKITKWTKENRWITNWYVLYFYWPFFFNSLTLLFPGCIKRERGQRWHFETDRNTHIRKLKCMYCTKLFSETKNPQDILFCYWNGLHLNIKNLFYMYI